MKDIIQTQVEGLHGYTIPALHNIHGAEPLVVIISHGFASDKESSTAQLLMSKLAEYGCAGISYDFPAHGESPVDGRHLRINECLDELAAVEAAVHKLAPQAAIGYFSSSFGAYINLLYLALYPHLGQKAFLRCAAVNMPELFAQDMAGEPGQIMAREGSYLFDYGFGRPLLITPDFCADLEQHDTFRLCRSDMAEMELVHGSVDEEVPLTAVQRFAAQFNIPLTVVEGADHRFSNSGGMEQVMELALAFFIPRQG